MSNIVVDIFAVLDCNVFHSNEINDIALRLLEGVSHPADWLVQLSIGSSIYEERNIIRAAMYDYGVVLPDNIGDLMAGLILMRYQEGEIENCVAQSALFDVVDAYGSECIGLDDIDEIELLARRNSTLITRSEGLIRRLVSGEIGEDDNYFAMGRSQI